MQILWDNKIDSTSITATSEDEDYPIKNILDSRISRFFRSEDSFVEIKIDNPFTASRLAFIGHNFNSDTQINLKSYPEVIKYIDSFIISGSYEIVKMLTRNGFLFVAVTQEVDGNNIGVVAAVDLNFDTQAEFNQQVATFYSTSNYTLSDFIYSVRTGEFVVVGKTTVGYSVYTSQDGDLSTWKKANETYSGGYPYETINDFDNKFYMYHVDSFSIYTIDDFYSEGSLDLIYEITSDYPDGGIFSSQTKNGIMYFYNDSNSVGHAIFTDGTTIEEVSFPADCVYYDSASDDDYFYLLCYNTSEGDAPYLYKTVDGVTYTHIIFNEYQVNQYYNPFTLSCANGNLFLTAYGGVYIFQTDDQIVWKKIDISYLDETSDAKICKIIYDAGSERFFCPTYVNDYPNESIRKIRLFTDFDLSKDIEVNDGIIIDKFTAVYGDHFKITIEDNTSSGLDFEIGYLFLGEFLQLPNMKIDQTISNEVTSEISISESGQAYGRNGYNYRNPQINFPAITDVQRKALIAMYNVVKNITPVIAVIWANRTDIEPPIYCVIDQKQLEFKRSDNVNAPYSTSIKLREVF